MNFDELTISDVRKLIQIFDTNGGSEGLQPYRIGECYLIRTVTHYTLGRVVAVGPHEIVLTEAAWVADSGRYHEALSKGFLKEVEPYPEEGESIVGRGAVVDAQPWTHDPIRKVIG